MRACLAPESGINRHSGIRTDAGPTLHPTIAKPHAASNHAPLDGGYFKAVANVVRCNFGVKPTGFYFTYDRPIIVLEGTR